MDTIKLAQMHTVCNSSQRCSKVQKHTKKVLRQFKTQKDTHHDFNFDSLPPSKCIIPRTLQSLCITHYDGTQHVLAIFLFLRYFPVGLTEKLL